MTLREGGLLKALGGNPKHISRSTERLRTTLRLGTVALAAVAIAANFTNYGPLIPLLRPTSGHRHLFCKTTERLGLGLLVELGRSASHE